MVQEKESWSPEKMDNFFSVLISFIVSGILYKIIDINIFIFLPIIAITFYLVRPYVRKFRKVSEAAKKVRERENKK